MAAAIGPAARVRRRGGPKVLSKSARIVPGAAIAGPGLLILLWIALQAMGAFAWLPAVRRLRGDEERPTG